MKIKSTKLNKKQQQSISQQINNNNNSDIISFGFFQNYFNNNNITNNNCNEYKEYKISIIGNDINNQILINNTNEKLLKKSQLNKINQNNNINSNCNNIIATITVPKNNKKQSLKRSSTSSFNKSLTWVYYSYDCYGSKKAIYDDNNSNLYPKNDDLKCSSCNSINEKVFKINNHGMFECSKCLNIN